MKSSAIIVMVICIISILFLFLFRSIPEHFFVSFTQSSLCQTEMEATLTDLHGVMIRKYLDWDNHGYKTILLKSEGDTIKSTILVLEKSGGYDYLLEGDSVVKNKNTLRLTVHRKGLDEREFELRYGCNQN